MRSENKLLSSSLVLIKENKMEVRLSSKGKAKLLCHGFSMSYDFKLIFLPDRYSSAMYFYLHLILYSNDSLGFNMQVNAISFFFLPVGK